MYAAIAIAGGLAAAAPPLDWKAAWDHANKGGTVVLVAKNVWSENAESVGFRWYPGPQVAGPLVLGRANFVADRNPESFVVCDMSPILRTLLNPPDRTTQVVVTGDKKQKVRWSHFELRLEPVRK